MSSDAEKLKITQTKSEIVVGSIKKIKTKDTRAFRIVKAKGEENGSNAPIYTTFEILNPGTWKPKKIVN